MAWPARPETERLFGDSVPSVPLSTGSAAHGGGGLAPHAPPVGGLGGAAAAAAGAGSLGSAGFGLSDNTLDEPVWATLRRDVVTIGRNLRSVLIPVNWDWQNHSAALHNWGLWGPLIFMLSLAITLSLGEKKPSDVFALVFTEVALGAVILTINVILLGGSIVFFQSLCLIGYCLFPIVVAAIVCTLIKLAWVRTLVLILCLGWASLATVPFIGKTVSQQRRALAVYPVLLMYVSIGWLALVKS